MTDVSEGVSSINESTGHSIKYVGKIGGLLPIAIMNLFLTIITLGIYRFWAKTNIRKYLWSQTQLDGEPFEYTGTGGELFMGAIIVFLVFILPLSIGIIVLSIYFPVLTPIILILLYPFFIFLIGVAVYRAQVYRMSRTKWRAVRGAQIPRSAAYGWLTIKYAVLYFISLGLLMPYIICNMWNFMMDNKRFGSAVFHSDVKSKPLFKMWLMTYLVVIIVLGGFIFIVSDAFVTQNLPVIIGAYIFLIIAATVISAWFQAKLYNHLISGLKFQDVEFEFDLDAIEFLKFSVVNMLLMVFTLGLAAPFVLQRWVRLFCQNIKVQGQINFDLIEQSPETGPQFGEGLVEAFDLG